MFAKKVVVAVALTDNVSELLGMIHKMDFLNHSEVHFVHVFNVVEYTGFYGEFPNMYPVEADRKAIAESIESYLVGLSKEVLPAGFDGRIFHRCLFDNNPKARFAEYVDEVHSDLIILGKRQHVGLFESSFSNYVVKHTHANTIYLKSRS